MVRWLGFEFFIALRYFKSSRKKLFNFVITSVSILGVTVGVTALIITLSIMNGFKTDIQEKILTLKPDIIITNGRGELIKFEEKIEEKIKKISSVKEVSPFVINQSIIKKDERISGAIVCGIIPEKEKNVTGISKIMKDELLSKLNFKSNIIIGKEISQNLGANIGDALVVISPSFFVTSFGMIPRMEKFKVVGFFESGFYEYDSGIVFISLKDAQRLFNLGTGISGIGIKTDNYYKADKTALAIQKELNWPLWSRSWMQLNRNLFSALKLEKTVMFIVLALIIVVAAFNIISQLFTITVEKTKQIGILKSLGAKSSSIMRIFVYNGFIIGIIGTLLGVILGVTISLLLKKYQFIKLPADVYYINTLPIKILPVDILWVILSATIILFLSTLYPSYKASRVVPCEALRYE